MIALEVPKEAEPGIRDVCAGYKVTQQDYVRNPHTCPSCGSRLTTERRLRTVCSHVQYSAPTSTVCVRCDVCEAKWTEKWRLVGFEDVLSESEQS